MIQRNNIVMAVMMIGLCSPSFAQESHAAHYTKKSLKVAWHLSQIAVGSIVTFVGGHDLLVKYDVLDREQIADMQAADYVLYSSYSSYVIHQWFFRA